MGFFLFVCVCAKFASFSHCKYHKSGFRMGHGESPEKKKQPDSFIYAQPDDYRNEADMIEILTKLTKGESFGLMIPDAGGNEYHILFCFTLHLILFFSVLPSHSSITLPHYARFPLLLREMIKRKDLDVNRKIRHGCGSSSACCDDETARCHF